MIFTQIMECVTTQEKTEHKVELSHFAKRAGRWCIFFERDGAAEWRFVFDGTGSFLSPYRKPRTDEKYKAVADLLHVSIDSFMEDEKAYISAVSVI